MLYPDGPAPALARPLPRPPGARRRRAAPTAAAPAPTPARPTRSPSPAGRPALDLGRCLFCADCDAACPETAISLHAATTASRPATRDDLRLDGADAAARDGARREARCALFGRSLKLRQVSAGGCNACEADVNVLGTIGWDLGRFGIQFVASPRHADGLLITGPVTENMELALREDLRRRARRRRSSSPSAPARSRGGPYIDHPEAARRRGGRRPGRPLHPRLPAPPAHDPRRPPPPARPARGRRARSRHADARTVLMHELSLVTDIYRTARKAVDAPRPAPDRGRPHRRRRARRRGARPPRLRVGSGDGGDARRRLAPRRRLPPREADLRRLRRHPRARGREAGCASARAARGRSGSRGATSSTS